MSAFLWSHLLFLKSFITIFHICYTFWILDLPKSIYLLWNKLNHVSFTGKRYLLSLILLKIFCHIYNVSNHLTKKLTLKQCIRWKLNCAHHRSFLFREYTSVWIYMLLSSSVKSASHYKRHMLTKMICLSLYLQLCKLLTP